MEEVTPKSEALKALEGAEHFLLLYPDENSTETEIHWQYYWVTDEPADWLPAFEEFATVSKAAQSPVRPTPAAT